jgi:hypothetical protein
MRKWIESSLATLLSLPAAEAAELARQLDTFKDNDHLREFLISILGQESKEAKEFVSSYLKIKLERTSDKNENSTGQKPTGQKRDRKSSRKNVSQDMIEKIDSSTKVGNMVGLNGRLYCECQASKHGLLTNCLTCGKIICKLEVRDIAFYPEFAS